MSTYVRKVVDKIYVTIFPDTVGELSANFKYKLLLVVLVLFMSTSAAFTMIFFKG